MEVLWHDESFESQRAPEPVGAFPHARDESEIFSSFPGSDRGCDFLMKSRRYARYETNIVDYDIEKQCHAVFENVSSSWKIRAQAGNDIVDVTVFLPNMKKDFVTFNRIYPEYFAGPGKPNPTRTHCRGWRASDADRDRAEGDRGGARRAGLTRFSGFV